jgi:hypothetical protein
MNVSWLVTALCIGGSSGASPQDAAIVAGGAAPEEGWEFSIAPYLWMFGMDGDVRVRNTSAEFDIGFDDIFENLDLAAIMRVEARRGRIGLYADPVYGQISAEADSGVADVDVETELFLLDFGAFYRVLDRRTESGRTRVADVSVGGRYFYTKTEIDFALLADREKSSDYVDLTVGARYGMDVTDRLGVLIEGDVGGFGIGSSSEFSWNVEGLASWSFGGAGRLWAGYRLLDIDQDDGGSSGYDLTISGPLVGYEFIL